MRLTVLQLRSSSIVIAFLVLVVSPAFAEEPTPTAIYQQTLRSTCWVRGSKNSTGWLLDRDRKLVLTSLHRLGRERTVQVLFPEFKQNRLIAEREHYEKSGTAVAGQVFAVDPKRDLALIQLASVPQGARPIKLAADSPAPGESLHAIGCTEASQGLWGYSTGVVRQVCRRKGAHHGIALDASVVVCQLPINPGDEGGPVVSGAGELIGISTGTVEKTRLVSFCIDVTEVADFLKTNSMKQSLKAPAGSLDAETSLRVVSSPFFCHALAPVVTEAENPRPTTVPGRAIWKRLVPSVAWVASSKPQREAGTGCLVDRKRRLVLTALSLMGEEKTVRVWLPEFQAGEPIGQRDHYRNKASIKATVLRRNPRCGLALLELESLPDGVEELKPAAESAAPGESVYGIGNPIYATGLWVFHSGAVRQVYQHPAFARVLEAQMPFNPGDAGGPLVNSRGELMGLVLAGVPNTQFVTRCVDVSEIKELLKLIDKK
jgi:S1-C subfamily serine protease